MHVFIVGATSGIGKSIAIQLNKEGYQVIGSGRRTEDKIVDGDISWIKMDITDTDSVDQALTKTIQYFGKIDILIQCAGRGAIGPVEAFSTTEIANVFNLNLLGIHQVNQRILPLMRAQKRGRIILISSLAAEAGLPYQGVYCASKAALEVLTESLRMEVKRFGIQACVLQPGDFRTEVSLHRKLPSLDANSPYLNEFERIIETATANVELSADPHKVAQKVSKILKKKRLKPKYSVGTTIELLMPKIKILIPSLWFEYLIMKYYKL